MPPQRPGLVTFVAIVNIIIGAFGVMGVVGSVFSLLLLAGNSTKLSGGQPNPGLEMHNYLVNEVPGYNTWVAVNTVILVGATAAALSSGIGLLKLAPWSRNVTIGYAVYLILHQIVALVFNLVWIMPAVGRWQEEFIRQNPRLPPMISKIMSLSLYLGMVFGLAYVVWGLVMLGIMYSANVKRVFEGRVLSPEEEYDRRAGI